MRYYLAVCMLFIVTFGCGKYTAKDAQIPTNTLPALSTDAGQGISGGNKTGSGFKVDRPPNTK